MASVLNVAFVEKKVAELETVIANVRRGLYARRKLRKVLGENIKNAKLCAKVLNRSSLSTKSVDQSRIMWKNKLHDNEAIISHLKPMLKSYYEDLAVYKSVLPVETETSI